MELSPGVPVITLSSSQLPMMFGGARLPRRLTEGHTQ